jgi:8-oxo-dGTP pyrophosphatase MutT (NUDIX family)
MFSHGLISMFSFPGYLDNTVAGGVPSGMPVFESLVKECMEEANIGPDIVRKYARAAGSISYFFRSVRRFHFDCTIWLFILRFRTSKGWLQPEVE